MGYLADTEVMKDIGMAVKVLGPLLARIEQTKYKPTQDELRALIRCKSKLLSFQFWGAATVGGATYMATRRIGQVPSLVLSLVFANWGGQGSRMLAAPKCVEELLKLDSSPLKGELMAILEEKSPDHRVLKAALQQNPQPSLMSADPDITPMPRLPQRTGPNSDSLVDRVQHELQESDRKGSNEWASHDAGEETPAKREPWNAAQELRRLQERAQRSQEATVVKDLEGGGVGDGYLEEGQSEAPATETATRTPSPRWSDLTPAERRRLALGRGGVRETPKNEERKDEDVLGALFGFSEEESNPGADKARGSEVRERGGGRGPRERRLAFLQKRQEAMEGKRSESSEDVAS